MGYTDDKGNTAFVQASDLFVWCGREMVRYYIDGDWQFEFWASFIKRFHRMGK